MTVRSKTIRLLYVYKMTHRWEDNIKMEYSSISTVTRFVVINILEIVGPSILVQC